LDELSKAFAARPATLWLVGLVIAGYAVLEGVEAVGLWLAKRWAEYLTFVATALLLVPELYELTGRVTATRILTLIINWRSSLTCSSPSACSACAAGDVPKPPNGPATPVGRRWSAYCRDLPGDVRDPDACPPTSPGPAGSSRQPLQHIMYPGGCSKSYSAWKEKTALQQTALDVGLSTGNA
jgi:hypothetical protein